MEGGGGGGGRRRCTLKSVPREGPVDATRTDTERDQRQDLAHWCEGLHASVPCHRARPGCDFCEVAVCACGGNSNVASCSVRQKETGPENFTPLLPADRFSPSMSTGVYQKQSTPHLTRRDRSAEVCRRLHRRLAGSRRLDLRRRRTSGARCVQRRRCRSPPVGRRRTSRGRSYTLRTLGRWQRGRKINRSRDTHGGICHLRLALGSPPPIFRSPIPNRTWCRYRLVFVIRFLQLFVIRAKSPRGPTCARERSSRVILNSAPYPRGVVTMASGGGVGSSLVPCVCWVPKGASKETPDKVGRVCEKHLRQEMLHIRWS